MLGLVITTKTKAQERMTSTAPTPPPVNGYDPKDLERIRFNANEGLAQRYEADRKLHAQKEADQKKLRDYWDEVYRNRTPNQKSIAAAERYNARLRVRAAHDQAIQKNGAPAAPTTPLDTKAIVDRIQREAKVTLDAKARRLRYKKEAKAVRIKLAGDRLWAERRLQVQKALVTIAEENAAIAKHANARIVRLEGLLADLPQGKTKARVKIETAIERNKRALQVASQSPESVLASQPMGSLLQYV